MATASFGKVVKLNDNMAQKIIDANKKSSKITPSKKSVAISELDSSLLLKLK